MLKRSIDIFFSFFGLILLSPIIAFVAWQIRESLARLCSFVRCVQGLGEAFQDDKVSHDEERL